MTSYTREEIAEALRALASMRQKSEAALISMQQKGGRAAQLTLLRRRIQALALAQELVSQQLDQPGDADLPMAERTDQSIDKA